MTVVGRNADPTLRSLATLLDRSEVVTIGIDGGGLDDLLGFAVMGRERNSVVAATPDLPAAAGRWLVWNKAWASDGVLERRKEIAPRLRDFEADGDLAIVKRRGDVIDMGEAYAEVAALCATVRDAGLFPDKGAIGVDPAGLGLILEAIAAKEIDTSSETGLVVGIPQGWQLMTAIKTAEVKLAARMLLHGGTRLMAWCLGNAKVEPRGNAFLITKAVSGKAKIDPLMATFNAGALMMKNPQAGGGQTYLATDPLIVF